MPSDTAVLPEATRLPVPDRYLLRLDRCVTELSVRVVTLPLVRARLRAIGGRFDIGIGSDDHHLALGFDAALRVNLPLLTSALTEKRGLSVSEHPTIRFETSGLEFTGERRVSMTGRVHVMDTTKTLHLTGQLRHLTTERLVLWARGVLAPPRRRVKDAGAVAGMLARRRIHVEVAAEFVR